MWLNSIHHLRKLKPLWCPFTTRVPSFLEINEKHALLSPVVEMSTGHLGNNSLYMAINDSHKKNVYGVSSHSGTARLHVSSKTSMQEDRRTTALALLDNVKQLPSSPKMALLLGAAGLLPFIASPYLMITSGAFLPAWALYQNFYGATILSFLGGVRWGLTLPPGSSQSPDAHNLGYSVVPQLWGFASLVAASYMDCVVVGSVGLMLGLGFTGYMDMAMWGYPAWFKGLRFCLTLVAILALWTGVMCKFMLAEEKSEEKKD